MSILTCKLVLLRRELGPSLTISGEMLEERRDVDAVMIMNAK
jgi:hypothetical protein